MDQLTPAGVVHLPRWKSVTFLAIACLVSYALLTALIVLQNRTIRAQRDVIHLLFGDRQHFSRVNPSRSESARAMAPNPGSSADRSSPSSQANSEKNSKIGRNSRKARNQAPAAPPTEGSDPTDLRRVSISI